MANFHQSIVYLFLINLISLCVSSVSASCTKDADGSLGETNGITCNVIDHHKAAGRASSFDCIESMENSIVVYHLGDVTLECSAIFALDMNYDGALPALHIDLEFSKRNLTLEPNSNDTTTTYVIAIRFKPHKHDVWSANYIFHPAVGQKHRISMISVFVEKNGVPLFLPMAADETLTAYFDPQQTIMILPCRSQNYDSKVTLLRDFEEIELDDDLTYDPKVGFIWRTPEGIDPYGEYECTTEVGSQSDMKKVIASPSSDILEKPIPPKPGTKEYGILKFIPAELGRHIAICLISRTDNKDHKLPTTLVNLKFLNPPTYALKAGCLYRMDDKIGRLCSGRKAGKLLTGGLESLLSGSVTKLTPFENIDENDEVYEIDPIYPSGGIQCGYNRRQYFTGTDNNLYFDYNLGAEQNVMVQIEPRDDHKTFTQSGNYRFNCNFVSYTAAMPIWWILKFANGTVQQEFSSDSHHKYFDLTPDIAQVSCRISAWNSSQWFESNFDVVFAEPEKIEPLDYSTNIYFEVGSTNQTLSCKAVGTPKPTLSWLKNDKVDVMLVTKGVGDALVILFPEVTERDAGKYTCIASSGNITMEIKFSVYVQEKAENKKNDILSLLSCESIAALDGNNSSENNLQIIKTGDNVLIRVLPNCSQDATGAINFTATVGNIGTSNELALDGQAPLVRIGTGCGPKSHLRSVQLQKEIPLNLIQEGDSLDLRISEHNCSNGQHSSTNLSALVTKVVKCDGTEDNQSTTRYDSKTIVALVVLLIFFAVLAFTLFCAFYCMGKPKAIYYVNT